MNTELSRMKSCTKPGETHTTTDPETGEYLNEETMQVIEDARKGKNIAFKGSFDDFKSWAEAL